MMRTLFAFLALATLAACATTLPQIVITGADTFEVRYDAEATDEAEIEARAQRHCGGPATYLSVETRYDALTYRTYRCGGS